MRAYVLYDSPKFVHPEDMKKILSYLQARGSLNLTPAGVEDYYMEFSGERYSASWIHVDLLALEEFAEWLAEQDI